MSDQHLEQQPAHDWGDEAALNELRDQATSTDDHNYLDQVDQELQQSLRQGLGKQAASELVQLSGGVVTTREKLREEEEAGHDLTNPNTRV